MITKIEYSLDGGERAVVSDPPAGSFKVDFPPIFGYVTFELWVYDIAGNVAHETYWYLLEKGIVKSVQKICDGFRANILDRGYAVHPSVSEYGVREIGVENEITVIYIPREFKVNKYPNCGDIYDRQVLCR